MKYFIAALFIFLCKGAVCQEWHDANKKLQTVRSTTNGYYMTVGYFYRYDTVPCTYVTTTDGQLLKKGFKLVLARDGKYSDNKRTFHVFYDERLHRVRHVERFYFN